MPRTRTIFFLLFAVVLISGACSTSKAPGLWVTQDTGAGDSFFSANFVNENVGWLNGVGGRSYETPEENDNANKKPKPKKPGAKIEDPLKANQGFEVLQTTDGGQTWRQIPDQFKNKIRSVRFVDPQQGWALTIDRSILHTTDGGTSWMLQRKAGTIKLKLPGNKRQPEMEQPEQIDQVHFVDAMHGWAWGGGRKDEFSQQPGIFLTTIDGGQHWNEIAYPFDQNAMALFFLDAEHAWASTMGASFYKTSDGGLNWTKVLTKLPEDVFRSIFFTSPNDGWVVGRSGRIAKTNDGGRTWRKMYEIKDEFKMQDIFFTDQKHGWAVGDEGAVLYTPDAGESWIKVDVPVPARFMNVVFLNNRTGWAVGLSGVVLKYEAK
ncbi:MAG TPA: YCF48-related protein [Blastocatellia bacterium]|nr:YCF48-related protein [Blastocatellia bacterium]